MSESGRRILRVDLRTLDEIDDAKLEKLELLMEMVSSTGTDIEFLESRGPHKRDFALEAEVISKAVDALHKDNGDEDSKLLR